MTTPTISPASTLTDAQSLALSAASRRTDGRLVLLKACTAWQPSGSCARSSGAAS